MYIEKSFAPAVETQIACFRWVQFMSKILYALCQGNQDGSAVCGALNGSWQLLVPAHEHS